MYFKCIFPESYLEFSRDSQSQYNLGEDLALNITRLLCASLLCMVKEPIQYQKRTMHMHAA